MSLIISEFSWPFAKHIALLSQGKKNQDQSGQDYTSLNMTAFVPKDTDNRSNMDWTSRDIQPIKTQTMRISANQKSARVLLWGRSRQRPTRVQERKKVFHSSF